MDRGLWDQLYNNSSLLRPPGPFAYQSSRDLAIALFKSEKMDAAWSWEASPPASLTPVKRRIITDNVNENSHLSLLLGRWLLVGGEPGVQVYDLDATVDWHLPVGNITGKIKQLLSTVSTDGAGVHSAYVAALSARHDFTCVLTTFLHLPRLPSLFRRIYHAHLPLSGSSEPISFQLIFEKQSARNFTMSHMPALDVHDDLLVLVSTWGDITVRNIRTNQGYEIPHPQFVSYHPRCYSATADSQPGASYRPSQPLLLSNPCHAHPLDHSLCP